MSVKVEDLIGKTFNEHASQNMEKDFEKLSQFSKLKNKPEIIKLCKLWFALGHINSLDKTSHFNKDYYGPESNGSTH